MPPQKSYAQILEQWQEDDARIVKEMQAPVTRYMEQMHALAERRHALTAKTLSVVLEKLVRDEQAKKPAT